MSEDKTWFVYIMTNGRRGTLYVGVTGDLVRRVSQHREHTFEDSFTDRYDLTTLVWYEAFGDPTAAIAREKQLKNWRRAWKVDLVEATNSTWRDLWDEIVG